MPWTDEMVATMIRLRDQGYSSSQIGGVLGVSRNAVIGKVHRLGLQHTRLPRKAGIMPPSRETEVGRSRKRILMPPKVKQMRQLAAMMRDVESSPSARLPDLPSATGEPMSVSLLELTGCKFAVNAAKPGEEHLFCNAPRKFGSSYCPDCHARCYTKPHRTGKHFVMRKAA
jgi:hypothetical protein